MMTEALKNLTDMTREDFAQLPEYTDAFDVFNPNRDTFGSVVIVPTGETHDSGFGCMEFALIDKENRPICRVCGYSDVLHIDGIGGYGGRGFAFGLKLADGRTVVEPHGWSIDCLPCGYLRLFAEGALRLYRPFMELSSFEVFAEERE